MPQVLPVGWSDDLNDPSGGCDSYLGYGIVEGGFWNSDSGLLRAVSTSWSGPWIARMFGRRPGI